MTRRGFFKAIGGAGLFAAGAAAGPHIGHLLKQGENEATGNTKVPEATEAFFGQHQAGILTRQQLNSYFASFDLTTSKRDDVVKLLQRWTQAAQRMTQGQTAGPMNPDLTKPAADSGETVGLPSSRLTLTFGFGPGLFAKDGKDRYGLAGKRPEALADMPNFIGDQMIDAKCGGDLSVQACADDAQVVFHAVRQLARLAADVAQIRWTQTGFITANDKNETPRNLMGFKDGTQTPDDKDKFVWVGEEGPAWMHGGTYLVARRIRIALEHWDNTNVAFQQQVVGRYKDSGAPLSGKKEFDALDLNATDKDGNFIIPDNAHVRLAAAATNNGAQILRRGYSYNDGVSYVAERWPPWRQGIEYDAGLFFISYQRDMRTGFIKIFDTMSKLDAMHQFVTHNATAHFACPPGVREGEYIGQRLFEA